MKSDGKGRLWSWILAVPLAAVLLYYSLRGVDWSGVWRTIAGARWGFVVAASAFTCCSFFLRAVRWRVGPPADCQRPFILEQDLRADYGSERAPHGRDRAGAVEFHHSDGSRSQTALDDRCFAHHRRRGSA